MNVTFSAIESKPYDKLMPNRFQIGNEFTTFRAYTVQKDKYYSEMLEKEFYVIYDNHAIGKAILKKRDYRWASDLTLEEIKKDTFDTWNRANFEDLMFKFYGYRRIFGFWLKFEITKIGTTLKTIDNFEG